MKLLRITMKVISRKCFAFCVMEQRLPRKLSQMANGCQVAYLSSHENRVSSTPLCDSPPNLTIFQSIQWLLLAMLWSLFVIFFESVFLCPCQLVFRLRYIYSFDIIILVSLKVFFNEGFFLHWKIHWQYVAASHLYDFGSVPCTW